MYAIGWLALLTCAAPAWSDPDTLLAWHHAGPCSTHKFPTIHTVWANRPRIDLAIGETIHVRLYGHGADLAQDAVGSDISEWITGRGTTTDYPNAPIVMGSRVAKGYLTVAVKAETSHTPGNRTVTVKWLTGNESIPVRIVAACDNLTRNGMRIPPPESSGASSGGTGGSTTIGTIRPPATSVIAPAAPFIDIAPRAVLGNIFRRTGGPVAINNGSFLPVDGRWCANLPIPASGSRDQLVPLPALQYGVTNVGTGAVATTFNVRLRTPAATMQTATADAGLQPGASQEFQVARAISQIRVIRFAIPAPQGCFVNPNDAGFFEDPPLTVDVDSGGVIPESDEFNNSRNF